MMSPDIVLHMLIGLLGAAAITIGRGFCQHKRHQILVASVLLWLEAVATVAVVG